MAAHFDPYPDDDKAEQAPCGTWLGEASNGSSNWAHVDCGLCQKMKAKISAAHQASEAAIVEQMGEMAVYMRGSATYGTPVSCSPKPRHHRGRGLRFLA